MRSLKALPFEAESLCTSAAFEGVLKTAAENAEDVDRQGRFPKEAIAALKRAGSLGWFVPGGGNARLEEVAEVTFELSRRCSATGMIFAMHQIQVASLVRHGGDSRWMVDYLRRLVEEQRLIASATSEVGVGGNMRKSVASLDYTGELVSFQKKASTISYGAHADDLLTTLRRSPTADSGDQVLVLTHFSEMEKEQMGDWDTLGMRGTCSPGFIIRANCLADQVLPVSFATIAAETMVPVSHILWAHVWLGIATEAFDRAQNVVRVQARQDPGTKPLSAAKLADLSVLINQFRTSVSTTLQEYVSLLDSQNYSHLATVGYALRINNFKVATSEMALEICQGALRVCGFLGYKNGGPYSVGRHLRDAHSAGLMIANDRILATNASLLTVYRDTI
jgi:acyl-CoA dehydrogenase